MGNDGFSGPAEHFLALVYKQVHTRAEGRDGPYGLETSTHPMIDGLAERAQVLKAALLKIQKPMQDLAKLFRKKIADDLVKKYGLDRPFDKDAKVPR